MATGVNVKMGVSGISQFKQNINTAKTSIKTLDAELSLNEKQFKASGDAQTYMQQKSELLQKKLEEQKSVVAQAENALKQMTEQGVNKTSKAYQDMQQQLLRARGDMLDTETQMQNIGTAGEEAGNGVDAMNAQLKRIGDGVNYQNVISGIDSITGGLEKVVKSAWKAGEAVIRATLGAGAWADELATTAKAYEITPEQLQRMRKTANLIDTDVDTIVNAQKKLKQGIGKRDKTAMGAFAELLGNGYDPTTKKAEDAFWDIGEALMNLDNEYDKQVYAQKLFGKSWNELIPLFTTGREEYEKTMASWSVVSDDSLNSLTEMDDQYQKMQGEFETFKMEMLTAFSGPLTEGMATITGLFQELNEYLQTPEGKEMLAQMGETISSLITDLTNIDPEQVVSGLQSVVNGITESLKWISEHSGEVVTALEAVVAGWAALKVTGGVLKVLEVVNGLQWLQKNPKVQIPNVNGGGNGGSPTAPTTGTETGGRKTPFAVAAGKFLTSTAAKVTGGLLAGGLILFKNAITEQGHDDVILGEDGQRYNYYGEKIENWDGRKQAVLLDLSGEGKKFVEKHALDEEREAELKAHSRSAQEPTEAQKEATEKFWDDWWAYATGQMNEEEFDSAYDAFEQAFSGQEDLLNRIDSLLNETKDGLGDDWLRMEDLPDSFWESLGDPNAGGMPEEWQSTLDSLERSNEKMNQAAEELTGESSSRIQSTSEMTSAANSMKDLPGQTAAAVENGISGMKVYIDGQVAGRILAPYVGGTMAGMVTALIK